MIRLLQCVSCWYVFDDVVLHSGNHLICKCGDPHFRDAAPTVWNIVKYVWFHKTRAIKRMLEKENV